MATFQFRNKKVFYEINGFGKPILLLNGIMMSTRSWEPFVKALSVNNQLIRVDFFDQGQSEILENEMVDQKTQVDLVKELLNHIGIDKISVVGISYGGEIAIKFALEYGDSLERLILFNTTAKTSTWLKHIGHSWMAAGKTKDPDTYYNTTIPIIYSAKFYEENIAWMEARRKLLRPVFSDVQFLNRIERLTMSAETFDETKRLGNIDVPTLIVAAENDALTPREEQELLHKLIPKSQLISIPDCGHASMYEKPLIFITLILGFIQTIDTEFSI